MQCMMLAPLTLNHEHSCLVEFYMLECICLSQLQRVRTRYEDCRAFRAPVLVHLARDVSGLDTNARALLSAHFHC